MTKQAKRPLHRFIYENGLSLTLFGLFFIFLMGLSISGLAQHNEELASHHQPSISYSSYLVSGEFVEAVFENWESEFLQMGALVLLTVFLKQKGSADSKPVQGKSKLDTSSRYSIIHGRSPAVRRKAIKETLYSHSLSLALLALFLLSFVLHAIGGAATHNHEAILHSEEQLTTIQYVASSQFWFESFQNWQSEFLAVGALLVLSIFLRERGSTESKIVSEPNSKTGE